VSDSTSDVLSATRSGSSLLVWVLIPATVLPALVLGSSPNPLASDPDMYRGIAEQLSTEGVFAWPESLRPTAYRPPLYPLLLAAIAKVGGGFRTLATVQIVFSLLTVALTEWLAVRLLSGFDGSSRSRMTTPPPRVDHTQYAAIIAAGLVAVDPLLVQNTGLVMTETLATFLVGVLLCLIARGVKSVRSGFALGIVFGLCCLCRPTFWAFGGLVALIWLVRQLASEKGSGVFFRSQHPNQDKGKPLDCDLKKTPDPVYRSRQLALCICIGTLVAVAPWAIRNLVVFGRPIVTTTHGGYTLLLGHNPVYYREVVEQPWGTVWSGESLTAWQGSLEAAMRADGAPPNDEVARDRWMYRQAWRNIADDPGLAVRAGLTLLGRFWNVMPLSTEERSLPAVLRWGIGVFYTAVFVAMGLGVWRLTREEWSRWWPLVALIVSFTCVHSLYWADMRMRAPLVPAIALLAARGLRGSLGVDRESGRRGDAARA
jgi:hypothetical protein